MYEPATHHAPNAAFLLPALFAASASEMAAHFAKQFTNLAIGLEGETAPPPQWATPHSVPLKLRAVRLRDFATSSEGSPCLLCTPFALHSSALSDLAAGHSLVAALRDAGVTNLFVTDWQSASSDMRFLGIDDYLADLNVLIDEIGAPVDLIGLCQGGWMALVYAARFPGKVHKLVLAAAPVDTKAAPSALSTLADGTAMEIFREVVRLGDGLVLGNNVLKLWGPATAEAEEIRQLLESEEPKPWRNFTNAMRSPPGHLKHSENRSTSKRSRRQFFSLRPVMTNWSHLRSYSQLSGWWARSPIISAS
jgi:pimeloyl-ACP methyl ester carboxylesterase